MNNSAKTVVDKMFEAFASGNVHKILKMVSDDTIWIYHGTQVIPKGEFKGKDGARKFFTGILEGTEVIKFEPEQFIVEGNMVVVLGNEHQKVKRSGKELKQKWVQVYTVENNLITRMEEFATSEVVTQ
ncbi:MAG: nuclear transport factor 2 family protein [Flavisolibacter sp.]|nr:nuclear transport factor 2 family protein [Flavisolibacter sp.]MBD0366460.1 nuclear transport factor 2 family protein [Flavisolibacter sp.]MBD0376318.1 nuclear transport factor 2 family protein [Flavisolibacter sp.]